MPQTYPGIGAGVLLVFILAIGYYITPALLGGPNDQMVSYYIAYFTNVTINWGMACALGGLLLAATLVLYVIYGRFTRSNLSLGESFNRLNMKLAKPLFAPHTSAHRAHRGSSRCASSAC